MSREEEMIMEHECAMNARLPKYVRDWMILALQWGDEHPVNQWYKVEDELPPKDERAEDYSIEVLFIDKNAMYLGYYSFEEKMWVSGDYWFKPNRVTHWIPSPELPKEE